MDEIRRVDGYDTVDAACNLIAQQFRNTEIAQKRRRVDEYDTVDAACNLKVKTEIAQKRRRVDGYDTVDAACKLIAQQSRNTEAHNLYDPRKLSIVPYMGGLDPGDRSGKAISFVGSEDLIDLTKQWFKRKAGQELLFVGPKGTGKTCRLRAFANFLYAYGPQGSKPVCIWNMERARRDLCSWLLDAFKFAYKCANATENGMYDEALAKIENLLDSLKAAKYDKKHRPEQEILLKIQQFLDNRRDAGDIFTFIVDGVQVLDTHHHDGKKKVDAEQRQQTLLTLADIVRPYKVVWSLSPSALAVNAVVLNDTSQTEDSVVFRVKGFTEEQRQSFLEHSALGAVVEGREQRKGDMDFYAGFHPHFLDALDDACITVAYEKCQVDELIWTADRTKMIGLNDAKLSPTEVAAALEEEEDWARVLHRFIQNPPMSSIRKSAQKLEIKRANTEFLTSEQMIAEDQRYALDESHFCSDFVKQMYVEELHKKVPTTHEYGPWLSYAKLVIQSPQPNWSELGWLCERLCDDVISQRGMRISSRLIVNGLSSQPFSSIPKPKDIDMHHMLSGYGRMYIPIEFNFGKADAVVFYRDIDGQLHLIGLQFTTCQSKHQHCEDEFMSVNVLKQWVPDVVQLQREGKIVLHFVFVCTSLEPKEKERKGTYKELRNGATVGIVDHILHVIGFDYALEGRANSDVLKTLKEMARLREETFSNLEGAVEPVAPPPDVNKPIVFSRTDASRMKRAELDAYAINAGVDPRVHLTRKSLLDELTRIGVIVLEPAGRTTQGRAL